MEKKCRSCGASTEFRDHTLFSWGELIMPAEIRLCPRCKSAGVFVVDHLVDHGPAAVDRPAFCASRLRIEKHGELHEVMCPRCGASMFFVQHSDVSFGDVSVLAESWICECGTTLERADDAYVDIDEGSDMLAFDAMETIVLTQWMKKARVMIQSSMTTGRIDKKDLDHLKGVIRFCASTIKKDLGPKSKNYLKERYEYMQSDLTSLRRSFTKMRHSTKVVKT